MPKYAFHYEFEGGEYDGAVDAPQVYITADGYDIIEVLEDPLPLRKKPKDEDDHWKPGPFAEHLLALLNNNPFAHDEVTNG